LTAAGACPHPAGLHSRQRDDDKVATMPGETVHHDTPHRAMITACAIGATVPGARPDHRQRGAPYMQGSFSASLTDPLGLTSYITASAMRPRRSAAAARFGRKPLYIDIGFTIASMLRRGAVAGPDRVVRCQAFTARWCCCRGHLDIYPYERRGFAMAIWGQA
jgi:hypothetical protein